MDTIAMGLGSLPEQLPELHSTIVKEEPPDENLELEADSNPFCYETVTKEELIIEDVLEENNEAESDNQDSIESVEETSKNSSLNCIECGKSYPTRYELNRHVKRHYALEMGLFRCKYCDKAYSTSQGLRRHIESHEKPQSTASKQKLPKKKLKSKSATKEKVIIEDTVEANNEPESGTQDSKETVEISKNITLKCTECGKTFPKRFDLNRHIKRHEAMKMGLFRCKYCDKPFSTNQALQRHIESHEKPQSTTAKKKLPKKKSGSESATKEKVSIEDTIEANNESDSQDSKESSKDSALKCTVCEKTCPSRYELNRHAKMHVALKIGLYQCKYCDKALGTSQGLQRHIESHKKKVKPQSKIAKEKSESESATKEKVNIEDTVEAKTEPEDIDIEILKNVSLKCTECGKTFPKRFELNRHLRRHKALKMGLFQCKYCDKPYSTNQALQRHIESHNNKMEPQSMTAKKRSGSESATKEKVSIEDTVEANNEPESDSQDSKESSKNSTLNCTECGKTYPSRYELNRHSKRHYALKLGLYQCKYCDKALGTSQGFWRHIESHKKEKSESESATKEKVNIEDTVEANTEPEDIDIEILKNVTLKCTECDKTFPKRFELNRHLRKHKAMKIFDLNRHVKRQEALKMGLFRCKYCDKPYSTNQALQRHIESHNNKMEPKSTTSKENPPKEKSESGSVTKEKVIIEDTIEANNELETDGAGFSESNQDGPVEKKEMAVPKGRRSLSDSSTFSCPVCGQLYDWLYKLQAHMVKHKAETLGTEEFIIEDTAEENNVPETDNVDSTKLIKETCKGSTFECIECDQTFPSRYERNRHVRKHFALKLGLYRCKYCEKLFSTSQGLDRHIKMQVCRIDEQNAGFSKSSQDKPEEEKEISMEVSSVSSSFKCPVCGQMYDWLYKLKTHMLKHKVEKLRLFQCDLCNKYFRNRLRLNQHKTTHYNGQGRLACQLCPEQFLTRAELISHKVIHKTDTVSLQFKDKVVQKEDGTFNCTLCGKIYETRLKARRHFRIHLSELEKDPQDSKKSVERISKGPFICTECDKIFPTRHERNRHVQRHDALKMGLYRCKYCEKPLSTSQGLDRHIKSHEQIREQCAGFSESSQDKPVEEKEISMVVPRGRRPARYKLKLPKHIIETLGSFECDLCNKFFHTRHHLSQHKSTHNMKQCRFSCQLCPEKFLTRAELFSHKKIHKTDAVSLLFKDKVVQKEDGAFNCTLCGKIYEKRLQAVRHFRIHLSELEKDIAKGQSTKHLQPTLLDCPECPLKFRNRDSLRSHIFKHTAIKLGRYTCTVCNKRCPSKIALTIHLEAHFKGFTRQSKFPSPS